MSTTERFRWLLTAVAAAFTIMLFVQGKALAGIPCLITALLMMPLTYRLMAVSSAELQIVLPLVFVLVTVVVFAVLDTMPLPHGATLKTTYTPPAVTTTTSPKNLETVYRTPNGTRYHLDIRCGGEYAYAVTYGQATKAGLQPCKKCAGG